MANPDMQPELSDKDYVVERQLKPTARMDVIHELRALDVIPTAMIDVSDGLAAELLHICKNSGIGGVIFEDKMPIDDQTYLTGTELNFSPMTAALNGGEDYELLFTVSQEDYQKIEQVSEITPIGYITNEVEGAHIMMKSGSLVKLTSPGYEHF